MNSSNDLVQRCERARHAADRLLQALLGALRGVLAESDADDALQREQARAHGVAWAATYVHALRQMLGWAQRLRAAGRLGELEARLLRSAYGECLAQLAGGLADEPG